jgi:hypothetical protein
MPSYYSDTNALREMVNSVNKSTSLWRVAPLSSSLVFVDASVSDDTWLDGLADDSVVFKWHSISKLGALPLNTFIYLMITIGVIIFLVVTGNVENIILALNGKKFNYAPNQHEASTNEHAFLRWLRRNYPMPSEEPPLPSYAETVEKPRGAQVTSEDIRDCQSIIRKIYSLKVDAYNAGNAYAANQPLVAEMKRKANAGLAEIQSTVEGWVADQNQWHPDEWEKVCDIRKRIRSIPGFQPNPTAQFDGIDEPRTR